MDMAASTGAPRRPSGFESLTVAVVAEMVGVAPSTLRTWARRYGLEPSGHRSGLHRRYSETDVARLRFMRALTQSGLTSRDAARRALDATTEELAASSNPTHHGEGEVSLVSGRSDATALRGGYLGRGAQVGEVAAPVMTLLGTLGNGDAQGSTALLRLAQRDLGAARTWDERVLPARNAAWMLAPVAQGRADAMLASATAGAVGDIRLRRSPRNLRPVHVVSLPGLDDPAARLLLRAALAERSIAVSDLSLEGSASRAARVLGEGIEGVLVVYVGEGAVAAQLAGRLRQSARSGDQVYWGEGWLHWPGQEATMADVVRAVEGKCCAPSG